MVLQAAIQSERDRTEKLLAEAAERQRELEDVGDRSRNLKFSTHHQDQSMESSSNEREECIYIPL